MADIRATNITGGEFVLKNAKVEAFRSGLRGEVLLPGDDGYQAGRKVFNGMIDKRPAMIVRCAGTVDVVHAVDFARTHNLLIAVRGGGHSVGGKAVCDGGMLIDLSPMKGIHVDPKRRTARAQPGLLLGDFDRETQGFGLATPLGVVSLTGIAGLTLGGGLGWLSGKYGLSCDNLLSAEVVTADGRLLTASPAENEELFWCLRGGGGNFGIVTSFEYQLHPVGPVLFGVGVYDLSKAKEVLRLYRQFAQECPDEVSTVAKLGTDPDGRRIVAIAACYSGPLDEGEKSLLPIRKFGSPIAGEIQVQSYVELQSRADGSFPPGYLHYWKASFLRALSDDAIGVLEEYAATKPSPLTGIGLQQMHGSASRVAPADTSFAHRFEQWDWLILSQWTDAGDSEENISWTREFSEKMRPFVEEGVYVNNLGDEGDERVRAAYGQNYERLMALKNKYDPTNFFCLNQNIKPPA